MKYVLVNLQQRALGKDSLTECVCWPGETRWRVCVCGWVGWVGVWVGVWVVCGAREVFGVRVSGKKCVCVCVAPRSHAA